MMCDVVSIEMSKILNDLVPRTTKGWKVAWPLFEAPCSSTSAGWSRLDWMRDKDNWQHVQSSGGG